MTTELCDFEIELMRAMVGQIPALPWGAAVGACLESLSGYGMVARKGGTYCVTTAGLNELTRRGFQ
jgi:hypothetical protein